MLFAALCGVVLIYEYLWLVYNPDKKQILLQIFPLVSSICSLFDFQS